MPSAPRIFLSYRREDTAPYAGRLYDTLAERFGDDSVFMDVDAIDLGTDYAASINRAISSCDVVIALIGRDWLSAEDATGRQRLTDPEDVLRRELETALGYNLPVVPVLVQRASLPTATDLPPELAPLVRRQGFDLRDAAWHDDVQALMRRLERVAAERRTEGREKTREGRVGRVAATLRRHRLAALVAAALAVAAVAAGVILATRSGDSSSAASRKPTAIERRLLSHVSPAVRPGCEPVDWGPPSASGSISCAGAGLGVDYFVFSDPSVLRAWYALEREDAGIEPVSGECTASSFRGERPYVVGGIRRGSYFCIVDGVEPELTWTDSRFGVGAQISYYAKTGQPAIRSLLRQWPFLRLQS